MRTIFIDTLPARDRRNSQHCKSKPNAREFSASLLLSLRASRFGATIGSIGSSKNSTRWGFGAPPEPRVGQGFSMRPIPVGAKGIYEFTVSRGDLADESRYGARGDRRAQVLSRAR